MKLLVHFNMDLGEEFPIFDDWFKLYYIENAGMAFGLQIGFPFGKLLLSIFRIIATVAIGWYLYYMTKKQAHQGLLWCMALILGGAIGNVIDSIFYGVGKTQYQAYQAIITNGTVYVIAFIFYLTNIWTPTFTSILVLFGIGILVDSILTVFYAFRVLFPKNQDLYIPSISNN